MSFCKDSPNCLRSGGGTRMSPSGERIPALCSASVPLGEVTFEMPLLSPSEGSRPAPGSTQLVSSPGVRCPHLASLCLHVILLLSLQMQEGSRELAPARPALSLRRAPVQVWPFSCCRRARPTLPDGLPTGHTRLFLGGHSAEFTGKKRPRSRSPPYRRAPPLPWSAPRLAFHDSFLTGTCDRVGQRRQPLKLHAVSFSLAGEEVSGFILFYSRGGGEGVTHPVYT